MELNERAMPLATFDSDGGVGCMQRGLTVREYAAIHLCIPDSGSDELDFMIRRTRRERMAAKSMQGLCANPEYADWDVHEIAALATDCANVLSAMIHNFGPVEP